MACIISGRGGADFLGRVISSARPEERTGTRTTRRRHSADSKAKAALEALRDALMRYGTAEIFNTDRASQFTTPQFTVVLERRQIRISIDGTVAGPTACSSNVCGGG
jgi:transposase InsO family protein